MDVSEPKQNTEPEVDDIETNGKVQELIKKTQLAQEKLEKSLFYVEFMEQMQDPEMVERIERVIRGDPRYSKLQLVLYGIGTMNSEMQILVDSEIQILNLEDSEHIHMQLAFAILLRERFQWVSDIEVYNPALSAIDRKAINAFNCICLSFNEECRRTVDRPTLFFMPHLPIRLYDNVLQANWTPANLHANLQKIIILGNSFKKHKEDSTYEITTKMKVSLNTDHMLREIPLPQTAIKTQRLDGLTEFHSINPDPVYMEAFDCFSWHFFDGLRKMKEGTEDHQAFRKL